MTEVTQDIKVDDVYKVRYTQSFREVRVNSDLNHCFEGLAVATQSDNGIILVDTYWGLRGGTYSKIFKISDIGRKIDIEYYCNLNEITKIHSLEIKYYADEDIVFLHDQHACVESCRYYYIKNGAVRNRDKILRVLNEEIADTESKLVYAQNSLDAKKELRAQIEFGKPLNEIYF